MHPKNKYSGKYPIKQLLTQEPVLKNFLIKINNGDKSIDFAHPQAVKVLNKTLLRNYYDLNFWDIPEGYLCPPIPGRAEYIHHLADLLKETAPQVAGSEVRCLDIGTGANCIYPILGVMEYGWNFTASEIDEQALQNAKDIVDKNTALRGKIEIRHQSNPRDIFRGVVGESDYYHLMFCNPPFFESAAEAEETTDRKLKNLNLKSDRRNFGGQNHELWCIGGEKKFINDIAFQSRFFKDQVLWFSTLVSKKENLRGLYKTLEKSGVNEVKTLEMPVGNKVSRAVAWTFKDSENQKVWLAEKI